MKTWLRLWSPKWELVLILVHRMHFNVASHQRAFVRYLLLDHEDPGMSRTFKIINSSEPWNEKILPSLQSLSEMLAWLSLVTLSISFWISWFPLQVFFIQAIPLCLFLTKVFPYRCGMIDCKLVCIHIFILATIGRFRAEAIKSLRLPLGVPEISFCFPVQKLFALWGGRRREELLFSHLYF